MISLIKQFDKMFSQLVAQVINSIQLKKFKIAKVAKVAKEARDNNLLML